MDNSTYKKHIEEGNDRLSLREALIETSLTNSDLIKFLITIMEKGQEASNFAGRILELSCKRNLKILLPHLDDFCNILSKATLNGVVRSCAKICELLTIQYFQKQHPLFRSTVKENQFEKIIEAGFNWMITDQKIAVQAYTMRTLYLIGTQYDWIHEELALNIEKNIPGGSTGYKNRGRKVIKAIRTNTPLKL